MIDPFDRWREYGEKPDYAGLLTFSGMPYTQDAAELAGVDVAIVGAPTDDLVPTARARASARGRSAPPAARRARISRWASTAFAVLRVVDFGDAPSCPPTRSAPTRRSRRSSARCVDAGALPIILGGDHSIAEPDIRAIAPAAAAGRPDPLRHPHRHRRGGLRRRALSRLDHVPARRAGLGRPERYVQIGLRGYWPGETEFGWQPSAGSRRCSCTTCATWGSSTWSSARWPSSVPARCS